MPALRQFKCEGCGYHFQTASTEAEIRQEVAGLYGQGDHGDLASLCDECYRLLLEHRAGRLGPA